MYLEVSFKKIINLKKHFPKLNNKGGLLIPTSFKIKDFEFMKYRHLSVNWEIKPVTANDLPEEFSPKAVKLVDMFRRKTINLNYEVMLIFDYSTGELIYCFINDEKFGKVEGDVDETLLEGKNISIIHNHPKGFYSPPSARNFQILSLDFQDYELVSSWDSLWILESKQELSENQIAEIKEEIQILYQSSTEYAYQKYSNTIIGFKKASNLYGDLLLKYINNLDLNINLIRRDLNDN